MKTLYKYVSLDEASIAFKQSLIVNQELYFSNPKTFNDPLDCNIHALKEHKRALHTGFVSCFSGEKRNDDLMFAHYADHHRGMRVRFDVDTDRTLNELSVLGTGRPVIYEKSIPALGKQSPHHLYLLKSDAWSYEDEFRVFLTKSQIAHYEKQELVEIAFGFRATEVIKSRVSDWLKTAGMKHVKLLEARPSSNQLSFDYCEF